MNNDDLINSVLREYGYEGLINDASTTSIQQVDGGTITAARPLVSSDAPMLESPAIASEVIEPIELTDIEMFDAISNGDLSAVPDYDISVETTPAPDLDEETIQVVHDLAERLANESNVTDNLSMERIDNNAALSIEELALPDDPTNRSKLMERRLVSLGYGIEYNLLHLFAENGGGNGLLVRCALYVSLLILSNNLIQLT